MWRPGWDCSGNRSQRRFRPAGNGLLFDNSLNYEGLRLDSRMEKGYEEGCTWGASLSRRNNGRSGLLPAWGFQRFPPESARVVGPSWVLEMRVGSPAGPLSARKWLTANASRYRLSRSLDLWRAHRWRRLSKERRDALRESSLGRRVAALRLMSPIRIERAPRTEGGPRLRHSRSYRLPR